MEYMYLSNKISVRTWKKSTLMHIGILWAHTKPNSCIVFVIVKKSGIGANFIFYFNSIEYFPIIV